MEAINLQHTYLERIYSLNNKIVMDDAILDENDNSVVTNAVHMLGSNSPGPDSRKVLSLKSEIFVSNRRFILDFSQI